LITADELRRLLKYDPETGDFLWRIRRGRAHLNFIAGSISPDKRGRNYRRININGKLYRAHRLAWLYVNGSWPINHVDHINGNSLDNRIVNLREATNAENMMNCGAKKNNTSGFKGVSWHKVTGRWQAIIRADGKLKHLGIFATPEEAFVAYSDAAKRYHGQFSRF
jgi:hypothetical protein